MTSRFKIAIILLVTFIPIISSEKGSENILDTDRESVMREYKKTKFNFSEFFKNPFTIYWKLGFEPTCNYFQRTIRTICTKIYHKLRTKIKGMKELKEYNGFYGCYQFRIPGVKNTDNSDRIQRVNRCPFTLENGENLFISHCYTKTNSYFIYAAKDVSKKTHFKVDRENAIDANIIALVSAGKHYVWVWTGTPKI